MSEYAIRIDAESDEYAVTMVKAVAPSWRDVWAIVRGRYEPKVRKVKSATAAGMDRALKEVWSSPLLEEQIHEGSMAYFVDLRPE